VPAVPASRTPIFQQADVSPHASAVNRFGEFDNMPCDLTAPPTSEAGFQQHSFLEEGYDGDVSVSPDGKWLVFSSTRHNTRGDIYLQRVDGTSVIQLTNDDGDDSFPTFSPDGQWVAFCSTRAGNWDIYLMDRDGRGVVQITDGPSHDLHPSFAPDGKRLVYSSMSSRSGQWELWTVQLGSNQKRMIGHGLFPSWSPDRSRDRIAFQRARARGSRWFSLWTVDLVDGEARQLTEVAASTNAAVVSPSWSPDGKRLAFATVVEPAQLKEGKPLGQQDIWVIDATGTNRQRLTDGRGSNAAPHWAPDGRVYFISDRGGNESIWSASVGQSPTGTMSASVETGDAQK
jgi:Tol biopolymer transport system component